MMDHAEANKIQAVERYLLGDLQSSEREEFEEHFFSCPECAEEVMTGATFVDNTRAVLREDAQQAKKTFPALADAVRANWFRSRFVTTMAVAGFAVLAVATGYQNTVEIPRLEHAVNEMGGLVVTPAIALENNRGGQKDAIPSSEDQRSLFVPHEWSESYSSYMCDIEKLPGQSVEISGKPFSAAGPFTVSIPVGKLDPGRYALVVYGLSNSGAKDAVARHIFVKEQ